MRLRVLSGAIAALFLACGLAAAARAAPSDAVAGACDAAITAVERSGQLPPQMLRAIGIVESGRRDGDGVVRPWPWSIDVAGTDAVFASKAEAIAAVQAAEAAGIRSIDVGCMQINLQQHPDAFTSLDQAFDPATNVRYATAFLQALRAVTGGWGSAVAAYHSMTPQIGAAYALRVAGAWPLAGRYGLNGAAFATLALAVAPAETVDPGHLLTPAFRAERIAAALFAQQMQGGSGRAAPVLGSSRLRGRTSLAAMERRIDPAGTLTPDFRRERAEAALAALNAGDRGAGTFARHPAASKTWRMASSAP